MEHFLPLLIQLVTDIIGENVATGVDTTEAVSVATKAVSSGLNIQSIIRSVASGGDGGVVMVIFNSYI